MTSTVTALGNEPGNGVVREESPLVDRVVEGPINTLESARAIAKITHTLETATPNEAPFVVIVGAGFSAGVVPTVKDIVRKHLPAWVHASKATNGVSYKELIGASDGSSEVASRFWRTFHDRNESDLRKWGLHFELSEAGFPLDPARAYQAAFDNRLQGGLNSSCRAREFQRDVIQPSQFRINEAHFYLASLVGDLNELATVPYGKNRFQQNVALTRLVLTTNFDPLLQTALQGLCQPYCTSDRLELELDDLELEDALYRVHLVYVHGSVHRRGQAVEQERIREIKERNARSLRPALRRHGVIVLGHSGWDDAIVEALATCSDCNHHVYWCGLEDDPLQSGAFGPKVATILRKPWTHYVRIAGADAFMRELWTAVACPPGSESITGPAPSQTDRLVARLQQRLTSIVPSSVVKADTPRPAAPVPAPASTGGHVAQELMVRSGESIAAAIQAAPVGSRIRILPGTYRESLRLEKRLELVGDGDPEEIRIEATGGAALDLQVASVRVANLTFAQALRRDQSAVDVSHSDVTLENCCVESDGVGIRVHGAQANALLRGNRVRECDEGIVLSRGTQARLEANEVYHNRRSGVVIRSGASPWLSANKIHHNGHVGVLVQGSNGTLEKNSIFANGREGVMISERGNPELKRNRISQNVKAGVYVCDGGRGQLEENVIESNHNSGVAIRTAGDPKVLRNKIHFNNGMGVWCADGAAGIVEDNDLTDNKHGASWYSNSTTVFARNLEKKPNGGQAAPSADS